MSSDATYTLARGEQQYGPYTFDQLREYSTQGSIQPTDLVWTPGMPSWKPVSEVLLSAESPAASPPPIPAAPHTASNVPKPPSLHWLVVLLLSVVTFWIFGLVWMFVQAVWVRRIDPTSKGLRIIAIGIPIQLILTFAAADTTGGEGLELLAGLIGLTTILVAYFDMRASIETRFHLDLSGLMTFFFNILYLQYHMRRIARGEHTPRAEGILR